MDAAMPETRIRSLEIERAHDVTTENLVIGEVLSKSPQIIQLRIGNLILDFVPMLRTFLQIVWI